MTLVATKVCDGSDILRPCLAKAVDCNVRLGRVADLPSVGRYKVGRAQELETALLELGLNGPDLAQPRVHRLGEATQTYSPQRLCQ